jgi:hypothetical protein
MMKKQQIRLRMTKNYFHFMQTNKIVVFGINKRKNVNFGLFLKLVDLFL